MLSCLFLGLPLHSLAGANLTISSLVCLVVGGLFIAAALAWLQIVFLHRTIVSEKSVSIGAWSTKVQGVADEVLLRRVHEKSILLGD